jgi:hypothetical protein
MLLIIALSKALLKEQGLPKQPEFFVNGQPIKATLEFQKQPLSPSKKSKTTSP